MFRIIKLGRRKKKGCVMRLNKVLKCRSLLQGVEEACPCRSYWWWILPILNDPKPVCGFCYRNPGRRIS